MKKIYKNILSIAFLFTFLYSNNSYAQKTLKLNVNRVTQSPAQDCDGWWNDSDWQWTFRGDASGCTFKNGSNAVQDYNPNIDIWSIRTYYSRDCWPSSISVQFNYKQNDNSDCDDGSSGSRTDTWTCPAWNATNNNYQADGSTTGTTNYSGVTSNQACGSNHTFNYYANWVVGGSNFNAGNLDANGYVSNKTCATAIDIDGGVEATGSRVTNHANQCTDAWYIYDVTSTNLTSLTFNGANGTVTVYTGTCTSLCLIGSGSGGYTVNAPVPPGRYYIRISQNVSNTNLNVAKTTGTVNNDFIASATNLGVIGVGTSLSANSNNNNFTAESSEPNQNTADNDYQTAWYYFTTGATVPTNITIKTDNIAGDEIDSDFHLYLKNDDNYTFPRCGVNWAKLSSLGDGDGGDNYVNITSACLIVGSNASELTVNCLEPNKTYYIQVRGYQNDGG
jgi:hypothetical protein